MIHTPITPANIVISWDGKTAHASCSCGWTFDHDSFGAAGTVAAKHACIGAWFGSANQQ